MSRSIHKLSARRAETEKRVGKHSDGGGLWLFITKDGSKRWVFAYERNKKRREMGLGSASDVGLGKARDLASTARELLAQGIDPIEVRRAAEAEAEEAARQAERERVGPVLFGAFAEDYIDTHDLSDLEQPVRGSTVLAHLPRPARPSRAFANPRSPDRNAASM